MSNATRKWCSAVSAAAALTLSSAVSAGSIQVIEFHNTILNHYFITNPTEAAWIDAGNAGPGWVRTGATFPASDSPASGFTATCRFYTEGANSHFYAAEGTECNYLKSLNPGNVLGADLWTYEGTAFYVRTPTNGTCPAGTQPIYRLYNNRGGQRDSNHRFTHQTTVYNQMAASGWIKEGVAMCAGAPSGSAFEQEVRGYMDTVLGVASGDVADMDTLGLILGSALQGLADPTSTCPAATSNPPIDTLTSIPPSLTINFNYGNGCRLDANTTMAGSGSLSITNLVVAEDLSVIRGNLGATLNNIRLNGQTVASGSIGAAINLAADMSTGAVTGTVDATLTNLSLPGGTGGSGTVNVTLQSSGSALLAVNLRTLPDNTPIVANLSIVPQASGQVVVNTTGSANSVGTYALALTNLTFNPSVCEEYPVGGQVKFIKGGQTGTITFSGACNGNYSYVGP
jgi:hypothetical protein